MRDSKGNISAEYCHHCHSPNKMMRETIYWQLHLLAHNTGNIQHDVDLTEEHFLGLMTLLYELADKIFPEGKKATGQDST